MQKQKLELGKEDELGISTALTLTLQEMTKQLMHAFSFRLYHYMIQIAPSGLRYSTHRQSKIKIEMISDFSVRLEGLIPTLSFMPKRN